MSARVVCAGMKTSIPSPAGGRALLCLFLLQPVIAQALISTRWSAPVDIPPTASGATLGGGVGYSMVISPGGRLYAIMTETPSGGGLPSVKLRFTDDPRAASPVWGSITLPAMAVSSGISSPCIVMDTGGRIHLGWYAPATFRIGHAIYDPSAGTWSGAQFLYTGSAAMPVKYMQVEVDRSGTVHFLWHEGDQDTSGSSADVRHARMPAGASTFTVRTEPLNDTSALNAAFPIAHFGGCDGSVLAVAWREEISTNDWDVKMNVSIDNGATWRAVPLIVAGTPQKEWDPMILIDRHNIVHLTYPLKNGILSAMRYLRFDNIQALFAQAGLNAVPISDVPLTPTGETHELPYTCYDYDRDIVWLSWKQRHIIPGSGLKDDILVRHTYRKGTLLSDTERLTDVRNELQDIRFPDFQVVPPDGHVMATYQTSLGSGMKLMERLSTPDPLVPDITHISDDGSAITWSFPSEFAVQYQAESSENLATWQNLGSAVTGSGDDLQLTLPKSGHQRRFVRIQATRP